MVQNREVDCFGVGKKIRRSRGERRVEDKGIENYYNAICTYLIIIYHTHMPIKYFLN